MRKERMLTIQTKSASLTTEGMTTETWTAVATFPLAAGRQPIDGETLRREYGLSDAGNLVLYFTGWDSRIHAIRQDGPPQRIIDGTESYDIIAVYEWDNHLEIIGRAVN